MKRFVSILLVVLLCLSVFACGSKDDKKDDSKGNVVECNVIYIGVFEPTTGENGGGGMQEVLGIRYANSLFNTVNINGTDYEIQLVEVDNQSDKTAAVTAAQTLVSSNVIAVLGSYGSGVSIAAGETFANAKVPAVGVSCTNPQVTDGNDWYFRVCFLDPFQGTVMASYAWDQGYTKAAIISQNGDDYSTGLAAYFKIAFEKLGGQIVAEETYQTNETDFNAILTKVNASGAEVLFVPSSIQTATLLLPQAKALGISAAIMAGDTWENETIISDAAEGVTFSTFFDENNDANEIAKEFVAGFKAWLNADPENLKLNGGSDGVAAVSALGFDAYMVVYEALERLAETNSVAMREALIATDYMGVTGSVTFNEVGDANKDTAYIKTVQGGKFVFIKTQVAE
ncbi:MAG: ABC transporter substrate-binding protein [Eubacteriaceae bacterium]|nr:ABC transporter substrate-binding protein [Eubacteriaceae bacterium]